MADRLRILVIDDDAIDRMAVKRALHAAEVDAEIHEVTDAQAALAALAQHTYDCLLLDFRLPRIDGLTLLRDLRADGVTTPVVMLTGQGDEQTAVEIMKAGASDYLTKGAFPPSRLAQSIWHAVRFDRAEQRVRATQSALARTATQLARLQSVTSAFSGARTPADVARVAVTAGVEALGARAGVVAVLNPEGQVEVIGLEGFPIAVTHDLLRWPRDSRHPLTDVVRSSTPLFFTNREATRESYPDEAARWLAETDHHAGAALPLVVGGHAIGSIGLSFTEPQRFDPEDRVFMATLADQCAQAMDRARLYDSEARARAEAESANRAKDDFLAMLSHELRTPLNAVMGWARMLRGDTLAPERRAQALETIERNAQTQAQLIEDLLDVSRIITGKLRIDADLVDVRRAIDAAADVVRPAAETRRVHLAVTLPADLGVIVGDASRLQQVVWNLLSNAVKFTPEGGTVSLTAEVTPAAVRLRVRDTGRGIDPGFLPHVFERFRQADTSSSRAHGGLGLGLSIAHHLVTLHGGTIQAASGGEGHGATFTVTLPRPGVAPGATAVSPTDPPERPTGTFVLAGVRVLLVDDDDDARDMMVEALAQEGALVTPVSSAEAARHVLDTAVPDVLVSDIGMPDEDGYSFIRSVRARRPEQGGAVPAVALTGYASHEDQRRAREAGFDRHVSKPVDLDDLGAVVARLLGARTHTARTAG